MEWVQDKIKYFIVNFYSYDFNGILHNNESSDDIDVRKCYVVEDDDDDEEEEADLMKPVSPVVDKEITNTLIRQEVACIVIDD